MSQYYDEGANIRLYAYKQVIMVTPNLKQEITQLEANFCAALSDPNRLLILYALSEGARNVTELANELGLNQPTTSRHLKVLRERGLVYTVRTGTIITYHLSDPRLIQALDLLRNAMRDRLAHQANLVNEVSQENV
ncbi:Biofilm growth-associated repressor [Anaerolineae bacterium]|nr:winged helix-turn-helix transcriptional regulator [Anaerolineales bacterium]CAG0962579.1 Biofilm growth-associated repressor [Anaerolineae bacterium]